MRVHMWAFRAHNPLFPCAYLVMYFMCKRWVTFFLRTLDHCLLHHYIHWWFDCCPWLELSRLVLIYFLLIYLFFSWYLIRLTNIVLCLYQFTFCVGYFPHIILIHPTDSSIFFLSSLSSLIYPSWILSSSPIYSYWMSSWFMRFFVHVAFYTREYEFWSLDILSLVFFHFFHPITRAYVLSRVIRPP